MPDPARPPFHADHVGSLLRPQVLKDAHDASAVGRLTDAEYESVIGREIERVLRIQYDIGLRSLTDGEFRRQIYFGHFIDACSGFTMMESEIEFDETGRKLAYLSPAVTGRVVRQRPVAGHEVDHVRPLLPDGAVHKVTLPSPADMHAFRYREGVSDRPNVYPDLDRFFDDVTTAYREELADLARRGATFVQLDDTTFTLFCDPVWRARFASRGYDPDAMVGRYVEWINGCIADRPDGMTIALHQCRGNNQGEWLFTGGYDRVAEQVFGGVEVDVFFLEYDTDRAGDFAPLRHMRDGAFVVLGLVSSKTPQLEHRDDLLRRVEQAAAFVPEERLGVSPQCGFASTAPGNPLSEADQWRKLELVVDVAKTLWGGP